MFVFDVVNGANVGMIQSRNGYGFAPEPLQGVSVLRQIRRQKLEDDKPLQAHAFSFINHVHTAA